MKIYMRNDHDDSGKGLGSMDCILNSGNAPFSCFCSISRKNIKQISFTDMRGCVHLHACTCVHACLCGRACLCGCVCACMHVRAYVISTCMHFHTFLFVEILRMLSAMPTHPPHSSSIYCT